MQLSYQTQKPEVMPTAAREKYLARYKLRSGRGPLGLWPSGNRQCAAHFFLKQKLYIFVG